MTYEQFSADEKTVYAVIRAIEVIGEATKNIPEPVRRTQPAVPWREILISIQGVTIFLSCSLGLGLIHRKKSEDKTDRSCSGQHQIIHRIN